MATMTFTIRVSPDDHQLLADLAAHRNQTMAEQTRQILAEGIRRLLDPHEIDRRLAAERERLIMASRLLHGTGTDQR